MDTRADIWGLLHDGEITVVGHEDGALCIFVSIPYLRSRFRPLGDSFAVRLLGFRSLEIADLDGHVVGRDPLELNGMGIEVLGTESDTVPVVVQTTTGHLCLDFDGIEVFLDTGRKVDAQEIAAASSAFWREFEAKRGSGNDA